MRIKDLGTAFRYIRSVGIFWGGMSKDLLLVDAAANGLSEDVAGLVVSLKGLSTVLPWIAGIAAAIGLVTVAVKAYKAAHPSLETLQKDAEAAKTEFEEMEQKVKDLFFVHNNKHYYLQIKYICYSGFLNCVRTFVRTRLREK